MAALLLTVRLAGQGSLADYERANHLREITANKVFNTAVHAHWFARNTRFWYRNDLADDRREFIEVDAATGLRRPAFDHARLARVLSRAIGGEVAADKLPIDRLEFQGDGAVRLLDGKGKVWRCDLSSYDLREEAAASVSTRPPELVPRPSATTGAETSLTFINRTRAEARLYWIDPQGQRRSYGALRAGAERSQHTFAGHVWLATDPAGRILGVFEAGDEPGTAVIDERPPNDPSGVRQGRPRRAAGSDSPDGHWQAFFKEHNLQMRDLETGEEFSLSSDGTADDEYGGRVYWAPDSKQVVAVRTRKGEDRRVYYVESSPKDQLQPKLHSYFYLKPGDRIPSPKPQLFDVVARKHLALSDALFPNPWSVTEAHWEPDSRRFLFLYNQRGHQVLRLIAVDAATGATRALIDEHSPTFIDYADKYFLRYLDATHEVIWMSERDGWNHLYLYDTETGRVKNQITHGAWVVRGVDTVDADKRQIGFQAGGIVPNQDPYYVHYCRVNFDGTGLTVLTASDGTHTVEFSPDRRFLIDTWSRVDSPPVTELRRADDGQWVCELERADWAALLKTGWKVPERFVAKGRDGTTDIFGVIFRPTNFDPAKKYPVIEDIYAGPQDSFVPKAFRAFYAPQALAELGFVVVQIDGMGTSNRSKKFHDVCWKNLGDAGFPDRILWIQAAAARYPYLDLKRVGIYGGSAGGQSALRALLAHADFYKVAVADCGCHDNRMDKIWWNELWMGWPVGPEYAQQSNVTQAHNLQGKLLLMVGEMDENVDPASTMQVVNALIQADKDFEMLVIPGTGHGSAETPYGRRRRQDFFVRNLLGVEPRWKP
ncbi:MAG: prolyl oligopeptidase family serine peptidase [Verrucomicrobia bacterium]|nr:prolyl oligopeptidase family serine peptidase [Verrucomicrobiota bacterium]